MLPNMSQTCLSWSKYYYFRHFEIWQFLRKKWRFSIKGPCLRFREKSGTTWARLSTLCNSLGLEVSMITFLTDKRLQTRVERLLGRFLKTKDDWCIIIFKSISFLSFTNLLFCMPLPILGYYIFVPETGIIEEKINKYSKSRRIWGMSRAESIFGVRRVLFTRGTELGSLTTANFCFFTWKMTNILSDFDWNQRVYFFHVYPSSYFIVRATAYHNTWHFKEKSQKIQNLPSSSAENSSSWNVKEIYAQTPCFFSWFDFQINFQRKLFNLR